MYKAVLKTATQWIEDGCSDKEKICLESIFPELRESEDENLKNKSGYYKAGKFWKASTLWNAVKGKSPQRVPNRYILQECTWNISSLQHFADEVKNVQEVDLNYPIILDMNGNILDGAHRVVKAYLEGKDVDIVYLGDDEWPEPDYDEEKAVRETEDERVRKALIDGVRQIRCKNGITQEQMIAYLEKQKGPHYTKRNALFDKCVENCDPKTVEEVNKRVDDIMNMPELSAFEQALTNLIGDWEDDEERWPSKFVKKHSKHILDMARAELEKEQKPRWEINNPYTTKWTKEMIDEKYKEFVEDFHKQKLLPGFDELSPEEKMNHPCYLEGFDTGRDVQKVLDEQKSAEWSDDDEAILSWCISDIERAKYCKSQTKPELCDIEINWLKSLRPSWKPSKEQIGALNYAYCELFKREDVGHNILGPLQKLLDDLKKLM